MKTSIKAILLVITIFIGGHLTTANAQDVITDTNIKTEIVETLSDTNTVIGDITVKTIDDSIDNSAKHFSTDKNNKEAELNNADKASEKPGLPQFDFTTAPKQIFWLMFFFAFMYIFFSAKTLPAISNTIENRHLHIQTEMDNAKKFTQDAHKAQNDYEKSIKMARSQAHDIIQDADQEMKNITNSKNMDLKNKIDRTISKAANEIADSIKLAMKDVPAISSQIASDAVKKVAYLDIKSSAIEKTISTDNNIKIKAA